MASSVGKIFGGGAKPKSAKPQLPPVEAPTPMPDDDAVKRAKAREMAVKSRGKGSRADTILTQDDYLG